MRIPGVVGFRRGGLWRGFFKTFSTYAYMRTFLTKTPNNPPRHQTHHGRPGSFYSSEKRFRGPGCGAFAAGGMVPQFGLFQ